MSETTTERSVIRASERRSPRQAGSASARFFYKSCAGFHNSLVPRSSADLHYQI